MKIAFGQGFDRANYDLAKRKARPGVVGVGGIMKVLALHVGEAAQPKPEFGKKGRQSL
jgi:hypothetical protein